MKDMDTEQAETMRPTVSIIDSNRHLQEAAQNFHLARRELEAKNEELLKAGAVEARLREELETKLVTMNPDGILVLDSCCAIRFANPAAERLLGRSAAALLGAPFGNPLESDASSEIELVRGQGESVTVEMRAANIRWAGAPAVLVSLRDITKHRALTQELEAAKAQLERRNADLYDTSIRDELTGLLNRRGLETELWKELARVRRYGGSLTALVIDCDRFKDINTAHGYSGGDSTLKEVAARMAGAIRTTDVLARIGGDEFLVLLPETREAEGLIVAEKLGRRVSGEPIATESGTIKATISIGVSSVPKTASNLEDILVITRSALQHAKDTGRDRVVTASQATIVVPSVDQALSEGYFRVLRQPIVDLASGEIAAYEMSCRPKQESPFDVFRIAGFARRLPALDLHRLRLCVERSGERGAGRYHCALFASTLLQTEAGEIASILRGADRAELCIELNEEEIVGDPGALGIAAASLRESGVRLSLRNSSFGARSLEALISLNPAFVRINKAFLDDLGATSFKRRCLGRLLNISEALGAKIIAEGIEDEEDAEFLKDVGISYGQGSCFGGLEEA